jgi:hypothetical protein
MNFNVTVYPDGTAGIDFGTWTLCLDNNARTELRQALIRPCSAGAKRTTGPLKGVKI